MDKSGDESPAPYAKPRKRVVTTIDSRRGPSRGIEEGGRPRRLGVLETPNKGQVSTQDTWKTTIRCGERADEKVESRENGEVFLPRCSRDPCSVPEEATTSGCRS